MMTNMVSGEFTVEDKKLFDYLRLLNRYENIRVEPSGCAAFAGPCGFCKYPSIVEYCKQQNLSDSVLKSATQIVWATGGRMIPQEVYEEYLHTYL